MKRKICLTASFILLLALAAASCGGETKPAGTDTGTEKGTEKPVETESVTEADPYADRLSAKADLPEDLDFGKTSFRVLSMEASNPDSAINKDIWVEAITGESVDDTIYNRNLYVEELLNIKIEKPDAMPYAKASNTLRKSVNAGENNYDLYSNHMIQSGGDVLTGSFLNWYDIPYINFKNPWYPQRSVKELTVDDTMFLTMSDLTISSISSTYCIYFNKTIAAANDINDIYDIVKSGKWTLDKMIELAKPVYRDLDADNVPSDGDQYGYATSVDSNVVTFFWAFDVPLIRADADGITLTANNAKAVDTVTRLRDFFYTSGTVNITEEWTEFPKLFNDGKVLFIPRGIGETQTLFRDMENYGIIPFPKYDEEQDMYYTMLDGSSPILAVPKTVENTEIIGAFMEAMGEYSYKYLYPAYYDMTLKYKGTRDMTSIEMLDLIMEGRLVDFSFVYDNFEGFAFSLQNLLKPGVSTDFATYYAENESKVKAHYDKVLEAFLDAGND